MISLRDPLRDTLMFRRLRARHPRAAAIVMAAMSLLDYPRHFRRYTYIFIAATAILGLALATLGSGPGGSDAKVNLFFFQPVEVMRMLIVFFLAGYFAQNWDVLRDLRQKGGPLSPSSTSRASTTCCRSRRAWPLPSWCSSASRTTARR